MGDARRRKAAARTGGVAAPEGERLWRDLTIPLPDGMGALPDGLHRYLLALAVEARRECNQAIVAARRAEGVAAARAAIAALAGVARRIYAAAEAQAFGTDEGARLAAAIACRAGCVYCCHHHVQTTLPEALAAAMALETEPGRGARVATTAAQTAGMNSAARYAQHVPCPLLEDGRCSIYEARPLACRAHHSNDIDRCAEDFRRVALGEASRIEYLALTQLIANAISAGIKRGLVDQNVQSDTVELSAAVAALRGTPDTLARWLAGERAFPVFPG